MFRNSISRIDILAVCTRAYLLSFVRAISSTLGDMENRYNKQVERTALLEQELVDKARLEEELQRVRDELRGTHE